MKNKRPVIISLFCLLFGMSLFLRSTPGVIANDLMAQFSIYPVTLGILASAFFWAYGIIQIPVGYFSDRFGIRYTVFVFGVIGVAGTLMFALAQNFQVAIWARLLMGIGTAGAWVPALKYLSITYKPEEFASLTSLISSISSIGLVFSSYPMAFLVEKTNWRFPFFLSAVILFFLIMFFWFMITIKTSTLGAGRAKGEKSPFNLKKFFLQYYRILYFLVWAVLVYGVIFSFHGLWGVPYLQQIYALSREKAGVLIMFISIGFIVGGPFWGVVSDRFWRARRPVLMLGTLCLLLTMLIFLFQRNYPGTFLLGLQFFSLGFFGIVFLINLTSVKELIPLEVTGLALGILNTMMLLSVGLFQNITGYTINYFLITADAVKAYHSLFLIYSICILAAFSLIFLMPETFRAAKPLMQQTPK